MKCLQFLYPLLFLGLLVSCDIETPEKAANYYESIVSKTNPLITQYEQDLIDSFKTYKPKEMNSKFKKMESYIEKIEGELAEIEAFHEDETLVNNARSLVDAYKKALPLYEKKIEIESLPNELYTTVKSEESKELMNQIDEILNEANGKFQKISKEFGKNHNFPIKPI